MDNHRSLKIGIGVLVFICLVLLAYYFFHYLKLHPSTEDAYVQANVIDIAAQVTGPVTSIQVEDHQLVNKGQLLFSIDPAPFEIKVKKAQAEVMARQSNLMLAIQNAKRFLPLVKIGQEAKTSGDNYQAQVDSAKADLAQAYAALAQAQLNLSYTHIYAPSLGIVTDFQLRVGTNVVANEALFKLVEQNQFWVNANFKETDVERIQPNQPATIVVDMFPDHTFNGVVDAVSAGSGSIFSILPPENASGNWVKVTQRFPVKIMITDPNPAYPLRVGASATVTIDTSHYKR